jgi:hypothetical protein
VSAAVLARALGWIFAFALTELIEMPIHARALGVRPRRWLLAFTASAITHPIIYLALPLVMTSGTVAYLLVAESFAVLVEAWWLRRCAPERLGTVDALLWSLVANASSVAVSSSLNALAPGY